MIRSSRPEDAILSFPLTIYYYNKAEARMDHDSLSGLFAFYDKKCYNKCGKSCNESANKGRGAGAEALFAIYE